MRRITFLVPVVLSVALLAACGNSDKPAAPTTNGVEALEADAILQKSSDALVAAKYFHLGGSTVDDDGSPVSVDLQYSGEDVQGTITASGSTFDLLVIDGNDYFKGDSDFWAPFFGDEAAAYIPMVADKWVLMGAGTDALGDLKADTLLTPSGTLTKGDVSTIDGKQAIAVASSEGGTIYISLEGEPYPIKLVDDTGDEVDFTGVGEKVDITKPADSEIVDFSTFTG